MKKALSVLLLIASVYAARVEQHSFMMTGSYTALIEEASKSVVYLMTDKDDKSGVGTAFIEDLWFKPYLQYPQLGLSSQKLRRSLGSGVIISRDGLIVTSSKSVEDRTTLKVVVQGFPEPFDAKVLGSDDLAGLAVLKIVADDLPSIEFADPSDLKSGDLLFAIGNPFGIEPVISMGVVSTTGKYKLSDKFMQSDLFIHGGNIGGAVISANGNLAGIAVRLKGMPTSEEQGGFFLPIDRVKTIAHRIKESGSVKEAWVGIAVADLTQEMKSYFGRDEGVVITAVEKNTPAEAAGLKKEDLIILANDIVVNSVLSFDKILTTLEADKEVSFLYLREKRIREAVIRLGRLEGEGVKSSRSIYHHGMILETLSSSYQEKLGLEKMSSGVVVVDVDAGSLAEKSGFAKNDVIFQLDGKDVSSVSSFQELIAKSKDARFLVNRGSIVIRIDLTKEQELVSSR